MRTNREIELRIKKQKEHDNTGFEWTMYIDYLPFARARKFVPNLPIAEWRRGHEHVTTTTVLEQMVRYMPFAEKKAAQQRNLSSQRSLRHYVAWFWLLGLDDIADELEKYLMEGYSDYGQNALAYIKKIMEDVPRYE